MLHRLRKRLSYANVMSTLAVFIALGGSSYAAVTINGTSIKNHTITGTKLHHNTLTGAQINESRLGRVPRAKRADTLSGMTAAQLKIKCPRDTFPIADVCVEREARRERAGRGRPSHGRGPARRLERQVVRDVDFARARRSCRDCRRFRARWTFISFKWSIRRSFTSMSIARSQASSDSASAT